MQVDFPKLRVADWDRSDSDTLIVSRWMYLARRREHCAVPLPVSARQRRGCDQYLRGLARALAGHSFAVQVFAAGECRIDRSLSGEVQLRRTFS